MCGSPSCADLHHGLLGLAEIWEHSTCGSGSCVELQNLSFQGSLRSVSVILNSIFQKKEAFPVE